MKRFAFFDAWRKTYPICRMCKVLEVSARGYRAWRTRPMSQRQRDDMFCWRISVSSTHEAACIAALPTDDGRVFLEHKLKNVSRPQTL